MSVNPVASPEQVDIALLEQQAVDAHASAASASPVAAEDKKRT